MFCHNHLPVFLLVETKAQQHSEPDSLAVCAAVHQRERGGQRAQVQGTRHFLTYLFKRGRVKHTGEGYSLAERLDF